MKHFKCTDKSIQTNTYFIHPGLSNLNILSHLFLATFSNLWSVSSPLEPFCVHLSLISGSGGKESARNVGHLGSIPGLGRLPGEGKGYPLQYSSLKNSAVHALVVHGVAESQTWLSGFHFHTFTQWPIVLAHYTLFVHLSMMALWVSSTWVVMKDFLTLTFVLDPLYLGISVFLILDFFSSLGGR